MQRPENTVVRYCEIMLFAEVVLIITFKNILFHMYTIC